MTRHTVTAGTPGAIDEATAEDQGKALAMVQRLLRERGIRAWCQHTISLGLFADRTDEVTWPDRPAFRSWLDRYPPELTVIGPQGCCDVTVTMGPRSGCYLVSLRSTTDPQIVRSEHPEQVVDLILAAQPDQETR